MQNFDRIERLEKLERRRRLLCSQSCTQVKKACNMRAGWPRSSRRRRSLSASSLAGPGTCGHMPHLTFLRKSKPKGTQEPLQEYCCEALSFGLGKLRALSPASGGQDRTKRSH